MLLKRDWYLPGAVVCSDHPALERDCGTSIKWLCVYCGIQIAQMVAWKDTKQQPYSFRGTCCSDCFPRGNRWFIPGSIEDIRLIGWKVPFEVLRHQLNAELAFTYHPDHPLNKVYSE